MFTALFLGETSTRLDVMRLSFHSVYAASASLQTDLLKVVRGCHMNGAAFSKSRPIQILSFAVLRTGRKAPGLPRFNSRRLE